MSFEDWQKENTTMGFAEPKILSGFEAWKQENEQRGLVGELGAALASSYLGVGKGLTGTSAFMFGAPPERLAKVGTPWGPMPTEEQQEKLKGTLLTATEKIRRAQEKFAPTRTDPAGWAANVIGQAGGYMSATMAGGYLAGPLGAAGVGFAVERQNAYEEAISKGATEGEAQMDGMIVGAINAAIESLQIGKLMKFHKTGKASLKGIVYAARDKAWKEMAKQGKGFGAEILKTAIEEGLEEAAQESVSISVPGMTRGEWPRRPDGSIDTDAIAERVGGAALGGAVAGGILGGGGAITGAGVEAAAPSRTQVELLANKIQTNEKLTDFQKAAALEDLKKLLPIEEQLEIEGGPPEERLTTVYHGSTSKKVVGKLKPDKNGLVWVARDKSWAKGYGTNVQKFQISENQILNMDDPIVLEEYLAEHPEGRSKEAEMEFAENKGYKAIERGNEIAVRPETLYAPIKSAEAKTPDIIQQEQEPGRFQVGQKVKPSDRKNVGTIISIDETQRTAKVSFLNRKTGLRATKTFSFAQLESLRYGKRKPKTKKEAVTTSGIILQEQQKLPPGSPFEISESGQRRIATAKKFEGVLTELETKRPELRKQTEEARTKELQQFNEIYKSLEEDDPIIASRIARSKVKGFLRQEVPELTEQISRDEVVDLKQAVREANISPGQKLSLDHFFEDILAGRQPFRSHIKAFDKFFGTEILKKVPKPKPKGIHRVAGWIAEPFNLAKAIVCSGDFSAGGIQALMVAPSYPIIWGKGVGKGYRAFFSPEYVDLTELEIKTNPHYYLIEEHGKGLLTEIGDKTKGEEYFVSELAHRIPFVGSLVRASDRAFATTLNSIRANLFYQWMEMNPSASNAAIKEMLDHIGNLTGRGRGKPGGKFEKYAPELGAVLWAPRLYLGTIKSMSDVVTKSHIRKQAAGDLVRATAFLMGILGLASLLPDTEVELDPRSSDFGKIKHGNTRLAFFGRHTQMIRFVVQMVRGQKKSIGTGRIHSRPRLEMASRYLRSKFNPAAGFFWDWQTGKTFLGERMEWKEPEFMAKYFAQHTVPLFLQDVVDAVRYQGLGTALWTSPLGLHGIGMQTYEVRKAAESQRLKDHYAHMYFGSDWDQLGPAAQEALKDSQPLIGVYEDRARAEREKYVYEDWTQAEQRLAGQKVLKQLDKSVRSELERLEMPFGGLSRRLSSDWMLNEKKYEEYQDKTVKLINEVVPGFIKSPAWKQLSPTMQHDMLDQMLKECKEAVRQNIVNKAKFEDVQRAIEMQGMGAGQ